MTVTALHSDSLAEHEQVIERGLGTFVEVGRSLAAIRDGRLYHGTHGTFEAYCDQRWNLSRSRAYELMGAAETTDGMSAIADTAALPTNEAQARALSGLAPTVAQEVLTSTIAATNGKPTAAALKEAREQLVDKSTGEIKARPSTRPPAPTPLDPEPVAVAPRVLTPEQAEKQRLLDDAGRMSKGIGAAVLTLAGVELPQFRKRALDFWEINHADTTPTAVDMFNPTYLRVIAAGLNDLADEMESR